MRTNRTNGDIQKNKNVFAYVERLDLRPIIKTPAASENLEIKYVDTLILPKTRDAETMSAIAKIKMTYVDKILYLEDDEIIPKTKGLEYKNGISIDLYEKDFCAPHIECRNCTLVAMHAIQDTERELPAVELINIATLIMDNSLKNCSKIFEMKSIARTIYCDLPAEKSVKQFNNTNIIVNEELLNQLSNSAIILFNGGKTIFDKSLTVEQLRKYNIILQFCGCKIYATNEIRNHISAYCECNGVKFKKL